MTRMNLGHEVAAAVLSVVIAGGCAMDSVNPPTASMNEAATAATFTVLSYNVDGLPAILQDGGHPEVTTPIIGQKIRDYDIVNVEEDFNSMLRSTPATIIRFAPRPAAARGSAPG